MTALVTGGVRRLGRYIVETLRERGWRVLTSSHRFDGGADVVADLAKLGSADALFDASCALNGGMAPDLLVNNAAIFTGCDSDVRTVGFDSPKRLTERMAEGRAQIGAVVNILDAQCLDEGTCKPHSSYADAKRRLLVFTHESARRYVGTLRVNAVACGPVLPPEGFHLAAPPTPLGRPTPEAVADAVAWLASARFTTDCILPVSG